MKSVHLVLFYDNPYWGLRSEKNRLHLKSKRLFSSPYRARKAVKEWEEQPDGEHNQAAIEQLEVE